MALQSAFIYTWLVNENPGKEAGHMNETRNLCAQIPAALHDKVSEEKARSGKNLNQYITDILTEYYQNRDGGKNMEKNKTMAFQIPEELFQRIKTHLNRESARTGKKLTQREFVLGLIEEALDRAESTEGTGKEYTSGSTELYNAAEAADTGNETEESSYTQE